MFIVFTIGLYMCIWLEFLVEVLLSPVERCYIATMIVLSVIKDIEICNTDIFALMLVQVMLHNLCAILYNFIIVTYCTVFYLCHSVHFSLYVHFSICVILYTFLFVPYCSC